MRFSRLRLLGFKSFVDPGEFVIEAGLTGVVGPNGCGKSNLVEALRWVMGESSYKNMRASGMDDVIFSGSATRPARNSAEVTLFLDNGDRTAPPAFNDADELQVSRRIEREAGSVYRINGKEARAKDVQLLFADQSTGARSPSMVGQGRIGELIQAKPQARRALLEEAAGISGLHSRRHEAELRLRASEQNLERLDDVTGQLQAQVESLKRQARQAQRFRNLSADIRKAEATLLHLKWVLAKRQEGEAKSELATTTSEVGRDAAGQMEAAKAQAVGRHALPGLREAAAAAAAAVQRLVHERDRLDEEARRTGARLAEIAGRREQTAADIARERELAEGDTGVLDRLDEEGLELGRLAEDEAERERAATAALEAFDGDLKAAEERHSALTTRRAEAAATRNQLKKSLDDLQAHRARLERDISAADAECAALREKKARLADPAAMRAALAASGAALQGAEDEAAAGESALAAARESELGARQPLQDSRNELTGLEAEARTLRDFLKPALAGASASLVERISVAPGFETALGAAFGEDLELSDDESAAAHWRALEVTSGDPALPAGAAPLADFVDAPAFLSRRLRQIGVVESGEGAALQPQLAVGQVLVTRAGDTWRWDGFVASADAPTLAAQRLAQKNRLGELETALDAARDRLAREEAAVQAARDRLREVETAERAARERVKTCRREAEAARQGLDEAEKASAQLAGRQELLEAERRRLGEAQAESARLCGEAERALKDAPEAQGLDGEIDAAARRLGELREGQAKARARLDELRHEARRRSERLAAIAREKEDWLKRAESARHQVEKLTGRLGEVDEEAAALADRPDEIARQRRELVGELDRLEAERRKCDDALHVAETVQLDLDRKANEAIQALASARERRGRAEERLSAAQERRVAVEAEMRKNVGVEPHLVAQQAELLAGSAEPEIADVERRLERLKIERERLGAVNLRAEQEARELVDQLETMTRERDDVIEAIRRLREAIQSLNREGRERLLAAFSNVDAQFRRLFTHLFGGGTAELQLVESDDPLEAGLEILARPPGKRPQTMTLLSGGEQALTAMALIFAVFLTNPAPICVLDEVDAPLDDHNVERFCNLMDEMAGSTETRFVIITHNPITMARMNRLFGVTMAEQGVSQLVSVDLQTAELMREAG